MPQGRISRPPIDLGVKCYISGFALSNDAQYLLVPMHKRGQIWVFDPLDATPSPEWILGGDFVPVHLKHLVEQNLNLLLVATLDGRVFYPAWENFLGGTPEKWRSVNIAGMTELKALEIWKIAAYRSRLYALGSATEPDLGGVIVVMDGLTNKPTLLAFVKEVDEAPYDIDFFNDEMFLATGRGGTIQVRNISDPSICVYELSTETPFTPIRVRVCSRRQEIWVASRRELLWTKVGTSWMEGRLQVTSGLDCVNDFAFDAEERYIYATCTYSDRIAVININERKVSDLLVTGVSAVKRPLRIEIYGNRAYVLGHSNGKIWVIDLAE